MRKTIILWLAVFFAATLDAAADRPWRTLGEVGRLKEIGEGIAVIFSPDLAVPGNREFYERLGFLYIETPSWNEALHELDAGMEAGAIRLAVIETHGTNGHGLKVQLGSEPGAARSYISIGGLQERLEESLIPAAVISACNSGRLYRPGIYEALKPVEDEPLFLPATLGIVDATRNFDRQTSSVLMLRRKQSNLETLMEGQLREFAPATRKKLTEGGRRADGSRFIVSTMLLQMLLGDEGLELTSEGFEDRISGGDFTREEREAIFSRFLTAMHEVALRERAQQ